MISRRELVALLLAMPTLAMAKVTSVMDEQPQDGFIPLDPPVPASQRFIIPSMRGLENPTYLVEDNCKTIIYSLMQRLDFTNKIIEFAEVGTQRYRDWLKDEPDEKIPPHIQFGGAVIPGEGDPTFHSRWVQRTLDHIANGDFKW